MTVTRDNIIELASKGLVYADTPSYFSSSIRVLTKDTVFQLTSGKYLIILAGFEWDEASIPWIFTWAFPKSGKYAFSALIHDAMYYRPDCFSQKEADREFLAWMKIMLPLRQSYIRYAFVRFFGNLYWEKNLFRPSIRAKHNYKHIICTDIPPQNTR